MEKEEEEEEEGEVAGVAAEARAGVLARAWPFSPSLWHACAPVFSLSSAALIRCHASRCVRWS
jgi:hypothetical protein